MATLSESGGDVLACDGCGRTDAGPNHVLHIEAYTVFDPNVSSGMRLSYCAGCAANRGLTNPIATVPGWESAPV